MQKAWKRDEEIILPLSSRIMPNSIEGKNTIILEILPPTITWAIAKNMEERNMDKAFLKIGPPR
ncbi:MAG: hypothetical protein QXG02_04445, partial [Candidatus Anstonellales archaeon]